MLLLCAAVILSLFVFIKIDKFHLGEGFFSFLVKMSLFGLRLMYTFRTVNCAHCGDRKIDAVLNIPGTLYSTMSLRIRTTQNDDSNDSDDSDDD